MFIPRWIIYPERLFKESQSKNRKRVEVVFIINTKKKIDRLVKNGLNFVHIKKSVLYFQKIDLRAIYYRYYRMKHEKSKTYEDRFFIYKIYERDHHTNDHIYNILTYKARKGRNYLYDLVKCGNYTNIS